MPHHQSAVLLKVDVLVQLGNQFGPAAQAVLAHAHHAGLGDGRFSQGGQHGRSYAGGCAIGFRAFGLKHFHAVPFTRQLQSQ
ncbi:hypothetical protein D3C72_2270260 [compost metagenome]